jgi:hypothetical protein
MKNSFHLRSLSIWLFFQTNENPFCENRHDFADFQKNRRKIGINRILLKKIGDSIRFYRAYGKRTDFSKIADNSK